MHPVERYAEPVTLVRRGVDHGPIFHSTHGGTTHVSRKLTSLIASLPHRPSVNLPTLATWLRPPVPEDLEQTPYLGVFRVPAHHQVTVGPSGERKRLELSTALSLQENIDPRDAVREVSTRFVAAVRRHIEHRERVAVLVSGGVDSSAVLAAAVALARGATRKEIHAIAVHFAADGDDRPYLRDLADALGIVPIRISPSSGGPFVLDTLVVDGAPIGSAAMALRAALLTRARESGAEVALTGDGGDFLFDGNPEHLAALALSGHVFRALHQAVRLRVYWQDPGIDQAWSFVVRPLLARLPPQRLRSHRLHRKLTKRFPWAGPSLRAHLRGPWPHPDPSATPSVRLRRFLTDPRLSSYDDIRGQFSSTYGIEYVSPFLDETLIRFVLSLPPTMLFHGDRCRALLRLAMDPLVPDSVRWRPDKSAFGPAFVEMMRAAGGFEALTPLAEMRHLGRLGWVDPPAFARSLRALREAPTEGQALVGIWPALSFEALSMANVA